MSDDKTIRDAPMKDPEMLDDYGHLEGWELNQFRFRRPGRISLEADVAAVFRTSAEVNEALRMLIAEGRTPAKSQRE